MSDLPWIACAQIGAIVLFLLCVAVVGYCVYRDRAGRGMRVTNGQVRREDVTVSVPTPWLKDFADRTYSDTH